MPNIYIASYQNETVAAHIINGTVTSQVGGSLRRETSTGPGTNLQSRHDNNKIIEIGNNVYYWHTSAVDASRVYQLDRSGYSADISGLNGLFTIGETIVGQTSSATAIVADASVSGDNFLIVNTINGTFSVGETLIGSSSSATAVLASTFEQGGAQGFKGEWFVAHAISSTLAGVLSHSGLFGLAIAGETGLAGVYVTSGTQARAIKYSLTTESWTETGDLGSAVSAANLEFGKCSIVGDSIIGIWEGASATTNIYTFTYNPGTDTFASQTLATFGGVGGIQALGFPIVEWQGRIFSMNQPSSGDASLIEFSAGTWSNLITFLNGTAIFDQNSGGGALIIQRESLYLFLFGDDGSNTEGWTVIKFTNISGTITADNMTPAGVSVEEVTGMSSILLPETLAAGTANLELDSASWRTFIDQETNNPGFGTNPTIMWHCSTEGGDPGITWIGEWSGVEDISDQPGVTYTWNGTTTVTYTSGGTVIQPDDWIGLKSDNQLFRVTSTSGGVITIDNSIGLTIPSGATTSEVLLPITMIGTNPGISSVAFSENIGIGGGNRIYASSLVNVEIVSISPALGGETITYRAYSVSGSETVNIAFFFGEENNQQPTQQCTLSSPSSGTLNGKVIENITANNTTEYTVIWAAQTDGAVEGETRIVVPRVTL